MTIVKNQEVIDKFSVLIQQQPYRYLILRKDIPEQFAD